jgi:hypothetical protein
MPGDRNLLCRPSAGHLDGRSIRDLRQADGANGTT